MSEFLLQLGRKLVNQNCFLSRVLMIRHNVQSLRLYLYQMTSR
jgi:hypothetical protein